MEHTPGPWETVKSIKDRRINIIQCRGGMLDLYQIAKVKSALECDQAEAQANARLISVAPDMLNHLKYIEYAFSVFCLADIDDDEEIQITITAKAAKDISRLMLSLC